MPFPVRVSPSRRSRLERPRGANRKAGRRPGGVRITNKNLVTWTWSRSGAGSKTFLCQRFRFASEMTQMRPINEGQPAPSGLLPPTRPSIIGCLVLLCDIPAVATCGLPSTTTFHNSLLKVIRMIEHWSVCLCLLACQPIAICYKLEFVFRVLIF